MMDAFERFGLLIDDHVVKTPVALASMAGITDAAYVLERADSTGLAFIGGYSIDERTMDAARSVAATGERQEFLYNNPAEELQKQIDLLKSGNVIIGINLRGYPERLRDDRKSTGGLRCIRDRCALPPDGDDLLLVAESTTLKNQKISVR